MPDKNYYIYLMTNPSNTVIYAGVTNNLYRRIYEHQTKSVPGFTQKYNVTKLVYYEEFNNAYDAISREKQIKRWRREKKNRLVSTINPRWDDISDWLA